MLHRTTPVSSYPLQRSPWVQGMTTAGCLCCGTSTFTTPGRGGLAATRAWSLM